MQSEDLTGDGVQAQVGNVRAENLLLVQGPEGFLQRDLGHPNHQR